MPTGAGVGFTAGFTGTAIAPGSLKHGWGSMLAKSVKSGAESAAAGMVAGAAMGGGISAFGGAVGFIKVATPASEVAPSISADDWLTAVRQDNEAGNLIDPNTQAIWTDAGKLASAARSLSATKLRQLLDGAHGVRSGTETESFTSVRDALETALNNADNEDIGTINNEIAALNKANSGQRQFHHPGGLHSPGYHTAQTTTSQLPRLKEMADILADQAKFKSKITNAEGLREFQANFKAGVKAEVARIGRLPTGKSTELVTARELYDILQTSGEEGARQQNARFH